MGLVDFFENKNIFITGGSGFLGKVLIEKLLRSCPKVGTIYMLLREKKGRSLESRMEIIKALPLFDKLKEKDPKALDKVVPVKGDVCLIDLGLSEADRQMLIENVNIIYHTAASVRFDDLLRDAIIINARGTREASKLALELKNISLFVHVSTTYCNADKRLIEEKLYPPHADWRDSILLAEQCEERIFNAMADKYINPLPNTYTFAKSLAEHVVNDMCKGIIPTIIFRPSIVTSTAAEPIPGWNDNFNGPIGLMVAGGKGLVRTILGCNEATLDNIPVDILIKAILAFTYQNGTKKNLDNVEVYNASQINLHAIPIGEVIDMGVKLVEDHPLPTILWNPRFPVTNCWYNYYIQVLLFHMLPAFFLDIALRLTRRKPMLFSIQRKIYIANIVLSYFMQHSWVFRNDKWIDLLEKMNEGDKEIIGVSKLRLTKAEIYDFFKTSKLGFAKYVLKEEMNLERDRKNLKRLWYLDMIVRTIFFGFMFWLLVFKIDLIKVVFLAIENYIRNLH